MNSYYKTLAIVVMIALTLSLSIRAHAQGPAEVAAGNAANDCRRGSDSPATTCA